MITLPHAILSALRANARASRLHEQRDVQLAGPRGQVPFQVEPLAGNFL